MPDADHITDANNQKQSTAMNLSKFRAILNSDIQPLCKQILVNNARKESSLICTPLLCYNNYSRTWDNEECQALKLKS